ncbi:MAG: translation initiation factor IF-3 [Nitrospirae bacterium GWD2_57_9]|nr:MAG: translation initiation factor IF-3 [Nitrospirae bacterium GWD2_57_9]OGW50758.1 MAG: translation initiation factor IF-3 [Nitrospirae bacterium GWC2_57_9]
MIKVKEVRVISSEGEQLGVLDTREAIRKAEELGLDLVEVAPTAKPPVCRIMDFGKYKYELAKKTHESKKNQTVIVVKEIKLRPRTDDHDVAFKVNNIKRFLEDGNKVKVSVMFRGREMAHTSMGRAVLDRIVAEVQNEAIIEQPPRMEGKNMMLLLGPKATKP